MHPAILLLACHTCMHSVRQLTRGCLCVVTDADRADGRSPAKTDDQRNVASPARSEAATRTASLVEASQSAAGTPGDLGHDLGKGAEVVVEVKDEKKGGFCVLM